MRQVEPHLTQTRTIHRQILQEMNQELDALYFPSEGILSMVTVLSDGVASEGAIIGRYGVADIHALTPGTLTPARLTVQISGRAYRLPVEPARELVWSLPYFRDLLQRWSNYAMAQALQTAACNTAHPIRARLARWLLEVADQLGRDEFPVTHEFIAEMLGVTRPSVSVIAADLQASGTVQYRRGEFAIVDREAFEAETCECYEVMRARFGALVQLP